VRTTGDNEGDMFNIVARVRWSLIAALPAVVLLAACGESESKSPDELGIPEGAPLVDQDNLRFKPSELTVQVNETVYFVNSETALHTVDVDGEDVSGDMRKNDVFEYKFAEPGKYDITCKYHPQMRSAITVE
jgi:plastocyanin